MVGSYEQTSDAGGRPDRPRVRIEPVQWHGEGRVRASSARSTSPTWTTPTALTPMAASGAPLVLDLVGLTYCDSQGVAMLFRLARQAHDHGRTLTVANPQGIVSIVLEITRLDEVVDIIIDL